MKSIARSYLLWPELDGDLEKQARSCLPCQAVKQPPPPAPLHPWIWPDRPWQRIHIDFAGPFLGRMFMLMVDAHSKWTEVFKMNQTTSSKTIQVLRQLFSSYGLPEQVVSDNGPHFVSSEFHNFLLNNGIRHIRSSPYHSASNGHVEQFIRTFKEPMKASKHVGLTLSHRIANFLVTYRNTPMQQHSNHLALYSWVVLYIPALMYSNPTLRNQLLLSKQYRKRQHDQHTRERIFTPGQPVIVKNMLPGDAWIPGVVLSQLGPLTFSVDVGEGRVWRRHESARLT